ncbi:hypothetical protein CGLO_11436 [Colletotrichum gloeosporioides Cg-14]|uniref:Uncharacterized protein n=1 Tax=Colletotrichum gloeosporioides (strain Cg-14) TaxID=1237896 RepID=T0LLU8_COLGC|nr:hypothetical protein CGLO_11436 [Colletotrichum gloeosporioides Cg-14]
MTWPEQLAISTRKEYHENQT